MSELKSEWILLDEIGRKLTKVIEALNSQKVVMAEYHACAAKDSVNELKSVMITRLMSELKDKRKL